jgi:two-component system, chemotaxis family, chemotaxis protein CheY
MSCNVLIVDDSGTMRLMVRRALKMAELDVGEVHDASNGIEALAQLAEHAIGLILLDINMPTMNGLQLLTRMKQNERLKDIPIVIASTEGSSERIEQISQYGAAGYLRKPFVPEQLRDVLKPLVGVRDHDSADVTADGGVF